MAYALWIQWILNIESSWVHRLIEMGRERKNKCLNSLKKNPKSSCDFYTRDRSFSFFSLNYYWFKLFFFSFAIWSQSYNTVVFFGAFGEILIVFPSLSLSLSFFPSLTDSISCSSLVSIVHTSVFSILPRICIFHPFLSDFPFKMTMFGYEQNKIISSMLLKKYRWFFSLC